MNHSRPTSEKPLEKGKIMEAAGIEPARGSAGKVPTCRDIPIEACWLEADSCLRCWETTMPGGFMSVSAPQRFSASFSLAGFVVALQDGQLFIYENGGEGDSEPLTESVVATLASLHGAAKLALAA